MEIRKATEMIEEIKEYTRKLGDEDLQFDLQFLIECLEGGKALNTFIMTEKGEIVDIFTKESHLGEEIIFNWMLSSQKSIPFIKENFPKAFIEESSCDLLKEYGYEMIDLKSRYYEDHEVCLFSGGTLWKTTDNSTDIVDKYEKEQQKVDLSNLTFWMFDLDQMVEKFGVEAHTEDLFNNQYTYNGFPTFYGFHYFNLQYEGENARWHVCVDNTGKMVGVIDVHEYEKYYTISYIDVAKFARNHGVAKAMINALRFRLNPTKEIRLTRLSKDGKKCHIDRLFKEIMEGWNVKTYEEID